MNLQNFKLSFETTQVSYMFLAIFIFYYFVDHFDMFFEVSWCDKFLGTELAVVIFDSFMDSLDMSFEFWLDKFLVTNATFKFFWCPRHFFRKSASNIVAISSCTQRLYSRQFKMAARCLFRFRQDFSWFVDKAEICLLLKKLIHKFWDIELRIEW